MRVDVGDQFRLHGGDAVRFLRQAAVSMAQRGLRAMPPCVCDALALQRR
jgi:hypothetical protein